MSANQSVQVIEETDLNTIKIILEKMIKESQSDTVQVAILEEFADACQSSQTFISHLKDRTIVDKISNLSWDENKKQQILEVINKYPDLVGGRKKTKRKYRQNKKTLKRR
jgi:hypothetical protein